MNQRLARKAAGGAHPMQQMLFPDFRVGTHDERLKKLAQWSEMTTGPARKWTISEIEKTTGVPRKVICEITESARVSVLVGLLELKEKIDNE